jgi:hypothetical protein
MEGLDKGGQGPISGCCAIEEKFADLNTILLCLLYRDEVLSYERSLSTIN